MQTSFKSRHRAFHNSLQAGNVFTSHTSQLTFHVNHTNSSHQVNSQVFQLSNLKIYPSSSVFPSSLSFLVQAPASAQGVQQNPLGWSPWFLSSSLQTALTDLRCSSDCVLYLLPFLIISIRFLIGHEIKRRLSDTLPRLSLLCLSPLLPAAHPDSPATHLSFRQLVFWSQLKCHFLRREGGPP